VDFHFLIVIEIPRKRGTILPRAFYSERIKGFLVQRNDEILGILASNNPFVLTDLQRNTWKEQIRILKSAVLNSKMDGSYLNTQYHAWVNELIQLSFLTVLFFL